MPGSSELSDALNPNFYDQRQLLSQVNYSPNYDQHTAASNCVPLAVTNDAIQQQQQQLAAQPYTPHRSELADAINPAAVSPSSASRLITPRPPRQPPSDPVQLLKGLIQSVATYKGAVANEKKRRLVWEQDQEVKLLERQAELEGRVAAMQQEIDSLKSALSAAQTAQISPSPSSQSTLVPSSSGSTQIEVLVGVHQDQPEFVRGSSSSASPPNSRKRARSGTPPSTHEHEPMKLRTHRDSRPQTIQAAMRNHILRCMNLEHDKILPPSHIEGAALLPSDPIRFVWDQTTKKSPHNFAMKARVVSDILASKDLYPLVPAQEFMKTKLDGVFEQAFTTLRQKHVSQKGNGDAASRARERVEHKARRARRISRKKTKLANRLSMRKKLTEYSLTMFDAAFHMDCMSSEESSEEEEDESDEASSDDERPPAHKFLRIRYLAWRSSRLHQLFQTIDARDEQARNAKPKRGIGRKDRRVGLPKDGNPLPPKGVSRWMVSKKWLQEANAVNPGLGELLQEIVKEEGEEEGEDAGKQALSTLGPESDDEQQRRAEARQEEYSHTHAQGQMPLPPAMPLPGSDMTPDQYVQQYFLAAQQAQWTDNMETPAGYIDVPDYSPYSAGLSGSS